MVEYQIILSLQIENDSMKKEIMTRDNIIQTLENDCEKLRNIIQNLEKKIKEITEVEEVVEVKNKCYLSTFKKYIFGE
jgi:predicted RNase H-like nuclease (RuvC/YqgF family)